MADQSDAEVFEWTEASSERSEQDTNKPEPIRNVGKTSLELSENNSKDKEENSPIGSTINYVEESQGDNYSKESTVLKFEDKITWEDFLIQEKATFDSKRRQSKELELPHFEIKGELNKVGSQAVYLAEVARYGKFCALKMYNLREVSNEANILEAIRFPFLIHSKYHYCSNKHLYIFTTLIVGQDLVNILHHLGHLKENLAKFYSGQILLALEYLHYLGIVFRNLKPENVMIDHDGYVKMHGFKYAKRIDERRTYTMCGTPEYLAPESLLMKGYGKSVDWWSFGVFVYEITSGKSPFFNKDPEKMYINITNGQFKMTGTLSNALKKLLSKLLEPQPSSRAGCKLAGIDEVKQDPWFQNISWIRLANKEMNAPFKPSITNVEGNICIKGIEIEKNHYANVLLHGKSSRLKI